VIVKREFSIKCSGRRTRFPGLDQVGLSGEHARILLLLATPSEDETSSTADQENDWKRCCADLPRIYVVKQQRSEEGKCDQSYDREEQGEQNGFYHERCVQRPDYLFTLNQPNATGKWPSSTELSG
jgi:hypothetical protein